MTSRHAPAGAAEAARSRAARGQPVPRREPRRRRAAGVRRPGARARRWSPHRARSRAGRCTRCTPISCAAATSACRSSSRSTAAATAAASPAGAWSRSSTASRSSRCRRRSRSPSPDSTTSRRCRRRRRPRTLRDLGEIEAELHRARAAQGRRLLPQPAALRIPRREPRRLPDPAKRAAAQARLVPRRPGTLPDDQALHRCLLTYVSDYHLLATATLPHGVTFLRAAAGEHRPRDLVPSRPARGRLAALRDRQPERIRRARLQPRLHLRARRPAGRERRAGRPDPRGQPLDPAGGPAGLGARGMPHVRREFAPAGIGAAGRGRAASGDRDVRADGGGHQFHRRRRHLPHAVRARDANGELPRRWRWSRVRSRSSRSLSASPPSAAACRSPAVRTATSRRPTAPSPDSSAAR